MVEGAFRTLAGDDAGWGLPLLALWAVPLAAAFGRGRAVFRAAWAVLALTPVPLLFGAAAVAATLVPDGSFARVSPALVFWAVIAACYGGVLLLGPRTGLPVWAQTAAKFAAPAACIVGLIAGNFGHLSLLREYAAQPDVFWNAFQTHLALSLAAVVSGTVVGAMTGWAAHRFSRFRKPAFLILNVVQTLPSLALFGLLIVPMAALGWGGIGPAPALVALGLYAAFPIARATLTAFDHIDPAVIDAARGLGMGPAALFARIEFPLALPVVLDGVRLASVQAVGNTVVAALIGAGGLGSLVFTGLGQYAPDLILLGTLPVIGLAWGLDVVWAAILGTLARRRRP